MDGWKTTFLFGSPIFRGYVSFREGKWLPPWELSDIPSLPVFTFESMIFQLYQGGICVFVPWRVVKKMYRIHRSNQKRKKLTTV